MESAPGETGDCCPEQVLAYDRVNEAAVDVFNVVGKVLALTFEVRPALPSLLLSSC